MQLIIPRDPLAILWRLSQAGYEGYLVGGAVRDLIRLSLHGSKDAGSLRAMDYDFTTNATPQQLLQVFPEGVYENDFGTVSIPVKRLHPTQPAPTPASNDLIHLETATKIHTSLKNPSELSPPATIPHLPDYQVTTFRAEGRYTDHRRPEEVTWGKSLQDDLSRRDFTINAMAIQVDSQFLANLPLNTNEADNALITIPAERYTLIDEFGGMKDLAAQLLRPVGDPATRFEEDALRMLRAIRFAVQLNLQLTDETFAAVAALAADIQHVSWERIRDEFLKMLTSPAPAQAIELLEETGLLHFILPELREGIGIEQGGHHTTDVWTHSLDALDACPSRDAIVRFATLLHDVAKPRTFRVTDDGKITFYNHELIGARLAKSIAQRFRLSKHDIDRMFILVRHHMFYYQPHNTDAAIRRFMRKVGLENINDILDLREGDRLGSGARKTSWRLEEMKERMLSQLHQPFAVTDLKINGNDLMKQFQLKPGPQIGSILQRLFERVAEEPELNEYEKLREMAREMVRGS